MKILVTGGAGFIGSHIVDRYILQGHEVVVVDNLSTGDRKQINPQAVFYHCDIESKELEIIFNNERPEVVSHHAAQISVPISMQYPISDASTNIVGMLNLLENCRKYAVRKIIFASSGGAVYGEASIVPTPETAILDPQSPYAIHKMMGEKYLELYQRSYQLEYTVLRYANVYGPRQIPSSEAGVISKFINQLLGGEKTVVFAFPGEEQGMTRDYVYVEDVVQANLAALEKGGNQVVNIGTQIETTTSDLLFSIAHLMNVQVAPEVHPPRPGDIRRSCLNNAVAKSILGWEPSFHLQDGLKKTVEFFTNRYSKEKS